MADNLYLPQVDYTSRDYFALSQDLKALIPNFAPQWTSRDSSDFGIVLLELFAYMGDVLNYQIDRAANESFISTSTQRDTVLRLARLLNYVPGGINAATGSVTITNFATSTVTIAAGTEVYTQADGVNPSITFTIDSDIVIAAAVGSVGATAAGTVTQGKNISEEIIGTSDGTPNQTFALLNTGVITGSDISVLVGSVTYTQVPFIVDYDGSSPVFSTYTDGAGITYIVFGDDVSGKTPPNNSTIKASYRYSDTPGTAGNIAAESLTGINFSNVEIINPLGFSGGTDPESTDSVRVNAPLALRTINRAVSLKDYNSLAVQIDGVEKANAMSTAFTSVVLFIAAAGGRTSTAAFKQAIKDYFVDKIPPNTTLTVNDFTAVYPYVTVTVNVLPQYNANTVGGNVAAALYNLFELDNVTFNDLITQGDIYSACSSIDGVAYIVINDFEKLAINPNAASGIYSQTSTLTVAVSTSATNIIVDSTSGLRTSTPVGPRIISPTAFNNATITGITSSVGATVAITGITSTTAGSGTITYAATSPALVVGQLVTVTGATATQYNVVSQPVASVSTTAFTVTASVTSGSTSTATATTITGAVAISTSPTSTVSSGTAVVIQGFGNVSDLSCSVNEVPILEKSYINVITSGGTV
jgi:hypothetical protein